MEKVLCLLTGVIMKTFVKVGLLLLIMHHEDQSTSVIIGDSDEELPDNCGNACVTMRDSQSLSIKVDSSHNDSSKLTTIDIEETGQNKDPDNSGKFLCFCVIQQNLNTLISTKIYSAVVQQRCEELGLPHFF